MTTISIFASGSRGDVQPYVALGQGLRQAGYDVRLLASENFEHLATEAGIRFCSTGQSIEELTQTDEWRKIIEGGNFIKILGKMQSEMKHHALDMAKRLPDLLQGSDLIVTGMGLMSAVPIAQKLDTPMMLAYVFPFTPTASFASPLVPKLPFGQLLNRLSFHVTRQMFWQTSKAVDTALRQTLNLGKGSFWGPYRLLTEQQVPAMYGYSRHVLPRPADWPSNHQVTGYWYLDTTEDWTPPPDVMDFLAAGEPPVYIGFGSMGNRNPQEAGQIALEALKRSGQRGILATGWGGISAANVPKNVHLISSIPHSWLFPQMSAVVHHGGAGTTAAGLRAGIPSIIIPFMGDQPFWGKKVADLGVGPIPIPRKKLTSERLAAAITESVSNLSMRRKAIELGEKIQLENGIQNAVAFVDRFMERHG